MRSPRALLHALLVLLLVVGLSACPARKKGATAAEPGPPTVLDPTMLDRG